MSKLVRKFNEKTSHDWVDDPKYNEFKKWIPEE